MWKIWRNIQNCYVSDSYEGSDIYFNLRIREYLTDTADMASIPTS